MPKAEPGQSVLCCCGYTPLTSFASLLNEEATLVGLLVSHTARATAAPRKTVDGTIVKIVSSKRSVKSKLLPGPVKAGPNWTSELFEIEAMAGEGFTAYQQDMGAPLCNRNAVA